MPNITRKMITRQTTARAQAAAQASSSSSATAAAAVDQPTSKHNIEKEDKKEKKPEQKKDPSPPPQKQQKKNIKKKKEEKKQPKKKEKRKKQQQKKDPSPQPQQQQPQQQKKKKKITKKQLQQQKKQQLQLLQKPPFPLYRASTTATTTTTTTNSTTTTTTSTNSGGKGKGKTPTTDGEEEISVEEEENQQQERPVVSFQKGLESVVNLLRKKKKIVVLTGAGISVSCGIPDFRSRGTGLYSTLDAEELGLSCPEELFDYEVFKDNPAPFYRFARNLYFPLGNNKRVQPSDSHKLLSLLEEKKMLLRVYSQNIDGLEQKAGVSNKKVVYAHGSLQWASCCECKRKVNADQIEIDILNGNVARCQAHVGGSSGGTATTKKSNNNNSSSNEVDRNTRSNATTTTLPPPQQPQRSTRKRPRPEHDNNSNTNNINNDNNSPKCNGVMKPGVTFFGEVLRDNVHRALEADRNKVDALIVIGTSLSVAPISKVIGFLPANIPRILINRTIAHPSRPPEDCRSSGDSDDNNDEEDSEFRENYVFDAYLLGFCDDVTRCLAKKLFSDGDDDSNSDKSGGGSNNKTKNSRDDGGKLLACLEDDDDIYNKEDWSAVHVPTDRVFLFPGAQAPSPDTYGDAGGGTDHMFREIAHCDGCNERIVGTIQKCSTCFDYDLCSKCYPRLSKTHHDGKHHFHAEEAALFS